GREHDGAARALASGAIDATDLYTTDAEIAAYDLLVLEDVRRFFPDYEAVLLWRKDLPEGAAATLRTLEGRISAREMIEMNARVKLHREPEAAVAADFLARAPIVRNTAAGLSGISPEIRDSAEALGLPRLARLRLIELPIASPSILAGIQTAAVIDVGTATLGALIGAGGYGQPILTGIRLADLALILEGAVPAALLALLAQAFFELLGRAFVSRGLRL